MKFIKGVFSLLLILGITWLAYAQYRHIPFMDYQSVTGSLRADMSNWLANLARDEESKTISAPISTAEEPSSSGTKSRLKVPANPFSGLDQYVRSTPESVETDVATLAAYLGQRTNTDLEKARAIYVWLTDNIVYDDAGFNSGNYSSTSAEGVLQNRTSVCDGYSELYQALGKALDLNIYKISGYAKGYGYRPGSGFSNSNHAWNAIEIDGTWRIFDATWGAGKGKNVNGRLTSTKGFDEYWFNVDPYEAIFNHYPDRDAVSFVSPSITLGRYERMPYVRPGYFRLVGNGEQVFKAVLAEDLPAFPKVYDFKTYVKAVNMPRGNLLRVNEPYSFIFQIPEAEKVALIDANSNWTYLKDDLGEFSLNYQPTAPGLLKIGVKKQGSENFEIVLEYKVEGAFQ